MANCSTIKVWLHYLIPLFLQPENVRDVAQPGSALAWGARGRWFESSHPDRRSGAAVGRFAFFLVGIQRGPVFHSAAVGMAAVRSTGVRAQGHRLLIHRHRGTENTEVPHVRGE